MKMKTMIYPLLLTAMSLSMGHLAAAQDSTARTHEENVRIDSLAKVYNKSEADKVERRKDSEQLSDLKSDKNETKAGAKEAKRVENDANDAARESKLAYRQEKKAQKARERADKQAKKAAKAKTKSDNN
jgi:hypothetical protein